MWTRQALIDADKAPGVATAEQHRIQELERQVRDPEEDNEILKAASVLCAREPVPPQAGGTPSPR